MVEGPGVGAERIDQPEAPHRRRTGRDHGTDLATGLQGADKTRWVPREHDCGPVEQHVTIGIIEIGIVTQHRGEDAGDRRGLELDRHRRGEDIALTQLHEGSGHHCFEFHA